MPGFGRGPPLPGAPERGAPAGRLPPPGRGGMAPGPGAPGLGGAPGPPGRAPDGRGCAPWPTLKGLLPTRGERGPDLGDRGVGVGTVDSPGRGPAAGAGPGGVPPRSWAATGRCSSGCSAGCCSSGCSAGCCSAGCCSAGRSIGRCSAGRPSGVGATGGAGCSAAGRCGGAGAGCCCGAGGRAGPGFGARPGSGPDPASALGETPPLPERAAPEPPLPDGNESRSLRATGASTVEDADLTNSPRSLSLVSTSLLVTPSSFASSCTRALPATALLTVGAGGNPARPRC